MTFTNNNCTNWLHKTGAQTKKVTWKSMSDAYNSEGNCTKTQMRH